MWWVGGWMDGWMDGWIKVRNLQSIALDFTHPKQPNVRVAALTFD